MSINLSFILKVQKCALNPLRTNIHPHTPPPKPSSTSQLIFEHGHLHALSPNNEFVVV